MTEHTPHWSKDVETRYRVPGHNWYAVSAVWMRCDHCEEERVIGAKMRQPKPDALVLAKEQVTRE